MKQAIKNKYLFAILVAIAIIILTGLIGPKVSSNYVNNWGNKIAEKKDKAHTLAQNIISKQEVELLEFSTKIENDIRDKNPISKIDYLVVGQMLPKAYSISIFESNELVGWNESKILNSDQLIALKNKWGDGKSFFYESSLLYYLAVITEVESVQIFIAKPIQKKYRLQNSYYAKLSLSELIQSELSFPILIEFNELQSYPGSAPIINNDGDVIGSIALDKMSRDAEQKNISNVIELIQNTLFLFIVALLLLWFYNANRMKNSLFKVVYLTLSLITLRLLLAILNIGDLLGFQDIISPIYFSSTFLLGLAKSPIELFLTISVFLIVSLKLFLILSTNVNTNDIPKYRKMVYVIFLFILLILLYNGFTSTIKSVIFDSSILYFKESSILASYQTSFMYLSVLLIGLSVILFAITLLSVLINLICSSIEIKRNYIFVIVLVIALVLIALDEHYYSKSSLLFGSFFIIFVLAITYFLNKLNLNNNSKFVTLLFASSILSISFMNYYNSALEINSLKTIANGLTRSNYQLYDYYLESALTKIEKNNLLSEKIEKGNYNFSAEAFLLWNSTSLASEVEDATINIIDKNKNLLGFFSFGTAIEYNWNWDEINDKSIQDLTSSVFVDNSIQKIVGGVVPIKRANSIVGYVEIIIIHDASSLMKSDHDIILGKKDAFNNLSINLDMLKIYEFYGGKLVNYFTNTLLSKSEKESILNAELTHNKDALISIELNNETNIFYIKKNKNEEGEKLLAIGLSSRDLTWNLYDFFKVFFLHSLMILGLFAFLVMLNYKNWKNIRVTFKSKILFALLLVSIIPLILLAAYFKNISDDKNNSAINYKLGKRADNVDDYISSYLSASTLNQQMVFDKATKDLGINFSIYDKENLIYSSDGKYYNIELLSTLINPKAYIEINKFEMNEIILQEQIENYKFNSLYHKSSIAGNEYIIKISDLFNSYQLPMTGIELNVFLFGTYSLAILLIIILSTILANQISSPIEKLTKATQSVRHGDMDIQIKNIETGEVRELIDGFNLMVRELKKNQVELAEVERESAWREMAKQVAHEIKNPLTPMKLAVQHLVAAHKDNSEKFNSIFEKVTATIINQIDTLKNIASEFSSFAKMPSIKLEKVDIIEVLNKTVDLFIDEECRIGVSSIGTIPAINTDKEQFQRMIINLIRNSIQANSKNIVIELLVSNNILEIKVSDDGNGIKSEVVSKIFEDNFTTKKRGMGLGLAMSKRFVNQINGGIFVDKTSSLGTTIKIELPINK